MQENEIIDSLKSVERVLESTIESIEYLYGSKIPTTILDYIDRINKLSVRI